MGPMKSLVLTVALTPMVACIASHEDHEAAGPMVPGDSAAVEGPRATNPETFHVESMVPAPNSAGAAPLTTVTLQFNRAVDFSSATADTVWIIHRESRRRIAATISPGSTPRHVRLTPVLPLSTNSRYTVEVDGVAAPSGHTASYSARFFTRPHFPIGLQRHRGAGLHTYYTASYDPVTRIRRVQYMRTGPDMLAGTSDDQVEQLNEYFYEENQDNYYLLVSLDPGEDASYGTPDDVVLSARHLTWGKAGRDEVFYSMAGQDGIIGSADDYDTGVKRHYYDEEDRLAYTCTFDAGSDARAFTADDTTTSCVRSIYLEGEERVMTTTGPGADGSWRTEDDELGDTWSRSILNSSGAVVRQETHVLASNGTAVPLDTTLLAYTVHSRSANHLVLESLSYSGAGPDGLWNTEDDVGSDRRQYTYDSDGFIRSEVFYRAEADGLHGTGDDYLFRIMTW